MLISHMRNLRVLSAASPLLRWLRRARIPLTFLGLLAAFCYVFLYLPRSRHANLMPTKAVISEEEANKINGDFIVKRFYDATETLLPDSKLPEFNHTKLLVVAALKDEDTSWIQREVPGYPTAIYVVDDPNAPFHVPKNKGHEANVYLTYIIDHYDSLPDVVLFFHSGQYTWHNNLLLSLNSAHMIRRLSTDRVTRLGYMNARCHPHPGCPRWIHLDLPTWRQDLQHKPEQAYFTSQLWHDLFGPHSPAPHSLSTPCCAQFAASRDAIRSRSLAQYKHWRDWLLETDAPDEVTGRIFEYTWPYIFTNKTALCPEMHACYCDGFGVCHGGRDGFRTYMARRDESEELERAVFDIERGYAYAGPEKLVALKLRLAEMNKWLDGKIAGAFRRGEDVEARAKDVVGEKEMDDYPLMALLDW